MTINSEKPMKEVVSESDTQCTFSLKAVFQSFLKVAEREKRDEERKKRDEGKRRKEPSCLVILVPDK